MSPSPIVKGVQWRGSVSSQRTCVATSRPHPMAARRHSFAERQAIGGPPKPHSDFIQFAFGTHSVRIQFAFSSVSIRVPRLTQQGHDLAVALRLCPVEGRPAPLVSERRIRASFEETLGDRGVAVE
jgi:hypothetical protein